MPYLELCISVLLVNIAPAFVPPTWTILVFALLKYHLFLPYVILCGVVSATLGRYVLSKYIHLFARLLFNHQQIENISYLGQRLGKTQVANFVFTFLYSLTPLSTTALFVAAGIAHVKMNMVLFGFFLGRLVSYSLLALSAKALSNKMSALTMGGWNWENILTILLTVIVFFVFVFIDWKTLLEKKKIKVNFHVWRWNTQQ
jgi:membrane protein YqaA with SNARE-associated domain